MFKGKNNKNTLDKDINELERVFNAISDLIFIQDKDNTITKVNDAFAKAINAKPEEIIGKKCYQLLHKMDKPWPECPLEKTKIDKTPHTEEVNDPNIGKLLLVTTSPIFDDKGEFIGAVHIAKDITEVKQTEKILRDSEIKYKTIFDSSADAIMLLIPGNGFISANSATIKMFGCSEEKEFLGKHPGELSPKYQPDGELSLVKSEKMMKLAIEKGTHSFEWKHKRLNGEEFFAAVLLNRMELEGKAVLQATVRDITEQKKIEEELKDRLFTLERFQKVTTGRELKMKELKAKIAELEAKLNQK